MKKTTPRHAMLILIKNTWCVGRTLCKTKKEKNNSKQYKKKIQDRRQYKNIFLKYKIKKNTKL